jgi:hypothetical protein
MRLCSSVGGLATERYLSCCPARAPAGCPVDPAACSCGKERSMSRLSEGPRFSNPNREWWGSVLASPSPPGRKRMGARPERRLATSASISSRYGASPRPRVVRREAPPSGALRPSSRARVKRRPTIAPEVHGSSALSPPSGGGLSASPHHHSRPAFLDESAADPALEVVRRTRKFRVRSLPEPQGAVSTISTTDLIGPRGAGSWRGSANSRPNLGPRSRSWDLFLRCVVHGSARGFSLRVPWQLAPGRLQS